MHVRQWVTLHGFALNVDPDLAWFARIVPCGLTTPVISLDAARRARGLGAAPSVAEVAALVGPRLVARLLDAPS